MTSPVTPDEPESARNDPTLRNLGDLLARSEDREAAPRTEAGRILLHEHSSGTPHMARHIVAIETEARGALSTAWAAAESALPEGWRMRGVHDSDDEWEATAQGPQIDGPGPDGWPGVRGWYSPGPVRSIDEMTRWHAEQESATGPTATAALAALTARLQARSTEQGGAG